MALVAHLNLKIHQIDIKIAFLNGNRRKGLQEAIQRFCKMKKLVCILKKSIYELKQVSGNSI